LSDDEAKAAKTLARTAKALDLPAPVTEPVVA
jgi:hypothetical protein